MDRSDRQGKKIQEEDICKKEAELKERLKRLEELEQDIKKREKTAKEKDRAKKQVLLRLSPSLWNELARWAEDDFRSINGQIEYLLSQAVQKRKR